MIYPDTVYIRVCPVCLVTNIISSPPEGQTHSKHPGHRRSVCQRHKLCWQILNSASSTFSVRGFECFVSGHHWLGAFYDALTTLYTPLLACVPCRLHFILNLLFSKLFEMFPDTGLGLHQRYPGLSVPRNRILRPLYILSSQILIFFGSVKEPSKC